MDDCYGTPGRFQCCLEPSEHCQIPTGSCNRRYLRQGECLQAVQPTQEATIPVTSMSQSHEILSIVDQLSSTHQSNCSSDLGSYLEQADFYLKFHITAKSNGQAILYLPSINVVRTWSWCDWAYLNDS